MYKGTKQSRLNEKEELPEISNASVLKNERYFQREKG